MTYSGMPEARHYKPHPLEQVQGLGAIDEFGIGQRCRCQAGELV
jgi:hypothetical protein